MTKVDNVLASVFWMIIAVLTLGRIGELSLFHDLVRTGMVGFIGLCFMVKYLSRRVVISWFIVSMLLMNGAFLGSDYNLKIAAFGIDLLMIDMFFMVRLGIKMEEL